MERALSSAAACRFGICAAGCTLAGTLLSGPVALGVLASTHPQPAWKDAETFARSYHSVQALPFFLGFFLVGGFVALIASLHAQAGESEKPRTTAALAFAGAFSALVFANYVIQTTLVPVLVRDDAYASRALASMFTMSNPESLGWGLEMWGYAVLGVATWLAAPVFHGSRVEEAARISFVANGPVSIAGGIWTALDPGFEMSAPGMAVFGLWNVLVVVMTVLSLLAFQRRLRGMSRPSAKVSWLAVPASELRE